MRLSALLGFGRDKSAAPREVVVYSREGCHLCDDAVKLLERYGQTARVIDIDADPELAARYSDCVPVVVVDGRVRFRGRINEVLLRRLLAHRG